MPVDRRRFAACVLAAAASITGLAPSAGATSRPDTLRSLIKDWPAAQTLGRAYLRDCADREAPLERARALLAAAPDERAARALMRRHCAVELQQQTVVIIDGWVMARTEADMLALVSLARG